MFRILRFTAASAAVVLLAGGCAAPPRTMEEAPRRTMTTAERAAIEREAERERHIAERAAREGFAPESGQPVVIRLTEAEMRAIQEREERALRAREAQERLDWGKVLTEAERLEVEQHGKLLTDEEREQKAAELAAAEEEARLEAEEEAKAAAEATAREEAARQAAADAEAAALQAKIDHLQSLGGDIYRIERNRLIDEGVIDESTDFRAPAWSDEKGPLKEPEES